METEQSIEQPHEQQSFQPNYILSFKAIHNFIIAMNEEFGVKNKPLRLYSRLIEQTKFSHENAIKKHVGIFTDFCISNRDVIQNKFVYKSNTNRFTNPKLVYSERVFIDLNDIFKLADKEQQSVMWQHLLTISALVDNVGKAKQILKETLDSTIGSNEGGTEVNYLNDIIEKVEKNIDINNLSSDNPMEAIGHIMSSGIFTDIISSMNSQVDSGKLDMSKMFSVVQNMVGKITENNPEMQQMMGGLMNGLQNLPIPSVDNKEEKKLPTIEEN